MLYVNKVVAWVLSPLGLLFLGCAAAAVLAVLHVSRPSLKVKMEEAT